MNFEAHDIAPLLDLVAVAPDVPVEELEVRLKEVESLIGDMMAADVLFPVDRAQRLLTLRDSLSGHLLAASTLQVLEMSASADNVLRRALASTAAGLVNLNAELDPLAG